VADADEIIKVSEGKWDRISRKSSLGRAAKPFELALFSGLY